MKKVLSLLLVCAMIFSLALVGSAAGEAYAINYLDVNINKSGNAMAGYTYSVGYAGTEVASATVYSADYSSTATQNVFAVAVSTKAAASAGAVAISYDNSVLMPMVLLAGADGFMGQTIDALDTASYTTTNAVVYPSVTAQETIATTDGLGLVWYNAGEVAADTVIAYVHFAYKEGKSSADLNADSIKFAVADSVNAAATDATKGNFTNYGAALMVSGGTSYGVADASNNNKTYPNYDVEVGGGEEETGSWVAGDAMADAYKTDLDSKYDYERAVVIFGKNVDSNDNAVDGELAESSYRVVFTNNSYEGKAVSGSSWAMFLYDDGSADHYLIGDVPSYSYKVEFKDSEGNWVEGWTGTTDVIKKATAAE